MHKRGFTEMQIVWIFILIAGAVILMIFAKIATNQKQASEAKISSITLSGLGNVFASLSISGDVFHAGELPKQPIKISCDKYSIGGLNRPFGNVIIFSPNLIKGEKFLSMTLPWNVPFRVTNFVYLTHPEVRYIFIDKGLTDKSGKKVHTTLQGMIPEKLRDENKYIEFDESQLGYDKNNYKVRLVYFCSTNPCVGTENSPRLGNTKEIGITKLEVLPNNEIKFYRKDGTRWIDSGNELGSSYYLDEVMLLGAIFTEDKENYQCVSGKAFGLLENVAGLNLNVENELIDYYQKPATLNTECQNIHTQARDIITSIQGYATGLKSPPLDSSKIGNIQVQANALKDRNSDAEKKSCVLIY